MLHASAADHSAADHSAADHSAADASADVFVHHGFDDDVAGNSDSDGDSDGPMVLKKMRDGARAAWRRVSFPTHHTCHKSHVTRHRRVVSFVHSMRQRHNGGSNYTRLDAGGQAPHQRARLADLATNDEGAAADDDFGDDSDATVELGPRGLEAL